MLPIEIINCIFTYVESSTNTMVKTELQRVKDDFKYSLFNDNVTEFDFYQAWKNNICDRIVYRPKKYSMRDIFRFRDEINKDIVHYSNDSPRLVRCVESIERRWKLKDRNIG